MKYVTVTIAGITQSVPEADVSLYKRAGYSVVEKTPAQIDPVEPPPAPVDPDPLPEVPEKSPRKPK